MHDFDYRRPRTLEEAKSLLASDPTARPLAGGMTLLPMLKQRLSQPSLLVDLAGIAELREAAFENGVLRLGAMMRHAVVAASPLVRDAIPGLAALAEGIGDPHVRNRGTIGGSVANADPAADYPAAVLALNAAIVTDRRTIAAADFFLGVFETALEPGEIITGFAFPVPIVSAYVKFPNPASRYATVGVFVAKFEADVRVAVTGAATHPFRLITAEAALEKEFCVETLDLAELDEDLLNSDGHAGSDYRAHLVTIITRRAVSACMRAGVRAD